ncbi:MAG: NrdH-redoxin [Betaproteobacteria bacterium]|nr:NrdH-redoxin [Betaproteobacteria bacterium]
MRGFGAALLIAVLSMALACPVSAAAQAASAPGALELELFVREGCPHCADAERFVERLRREQPALTVTVRDVSRDPGAMKRLQELVAATPGRISGVPAFHVRGDLVVGFAGEEASGARVRALLSRAPPAGPDGGPDGMCKIEAQTPCAAPADPDAGSIELPWIGTRISIDEVGLPAFTIAIGLLDGFNPCSMWVLIMMISMLAAIGDRRRMLAIAGTFVVIEGIAYFAFMAAWLNLFLLIGISRASEIVLGVIALVAGLINVKDFFAFGRGITLSIPAASKPGIVARMRRLMREQSLWLAIAGTVVLAILVQLVELLCTSGLPALYTRILTLRKLDPWAYYGYLVLYNVVYMLDDVVVLSIGVVTLSQKRLQEKEGRLLKLLSGLVMLGLGLYLVLAPR